LGQSHFERWWKAFPEGIVLGIPGKAAALGFNLIANHEQNENETED